MNNDSNETSPAIVDDIIPEQQAQQPQQQQHHHQLQQHVVVEDSTRQRPSKKRAISPRGEEEGESLKMAVGESTKKAVAVVVVAEETGVGVVTGTGKQEGKACCDKTNSDNNGIDSNDEDEDDYSNDDNDRTSKDYYFDSYAHHSIHEEMLKDEVRTRTYQMAILQNKHLFHDKIVLDVGCGTAILSMFAAQAGAKHVYAVDCSNIMKQARRIVSDNGFSEKITLIQGKVEEIELPVEKVDIIVSEWMGYFLLYESMLETVLFARDKWLVPNGIIFPDKAIMYMTAIEDGCVKRERFDFWDDVYGFNMSAIKDIALKEPVVDVVDAKSLVTGSVPILHLDILTCTKEDLAFSAKFKIQAQRNDFVHALVAYFECAFTQVHKPIGFSTAPFARYTHWKQTIFYLEETLTICAGESISGELTCKPNQKNPRDLDIKLKLTMKGRYSEMENLQMVYRLR